MAMAIGMALGLALGYLFVKLWEGYGRRGD